MKISWHLASVSSISLISFIHGWRISYSTKVDLVLVTEANLSNVYSRPHTCCSKHDFSSHLWLYLLMGKYLAGSQHCALCLKCTPKIRQKNLDNKDCQNFEADTHLASFSVLSLLEEMPIQGPLSILVHLEKLHWCILEWTDFITT